MALEPNQPLFEKARQCRFYRAGLEELAQQLPGSSAELDRLIGEAVKLQDELAFSHLVFAALQSGRSVDARHLVSGAALFHDPRLLCGAAMHMSGDVCAALAEATRSETMGSERESVALLAAAGWWQAKRKEPFPPDLIAQARTLARKTRDLHLAQLQLVAFADITNDKGLASILESNGYSSIKGQVGFVTEAMVTEPMKSLSVMIPERPPPVEISGFTVRRAVERIGRNDPCPCGSGKKYKRCCWEKDKTRLQHSSDVPGMTREEVQEHQEEHLTPGRLGQMRSYELFRIDPAKLAPEFYQGYVERLLCFGQHELVARFFEMKGCPPELVNSWDYAVFEMTRRQQKDLLLRMLKVNPGGQSTLDLGARLLLFDPNQSGRVELIENYALAALEDDQTGALVDLAFGLLHSNWPALGILVSRGAIPSVGDLDGLMLMEKLLEKRDQLHLSADDPVEAVLDDRIAVQSERQESESLEEVRDRLNQKSGEVKQLNARLIALEGEVDRQMKLQDRQSELSPGGEVPMTPDPAMEELRQQLKRLKSDLKQRHSERNELRRDLQEALREVEALRERSEEEHPLTAEKQDLEKEEEALLIGEVEEADTQPVRVPSFPRKFQDRLAVLPRPVARSGLALIGRLAAGDRAAFVGAKRLKLNHDVIRQRVGLGHRLLFRLEPEVLEVIDLVPRRDLERRIKAL